MKFYLSGGMEFKENHGANWRQWITGELKTLGHEALDPVVLDKGEALPQGFDWHESKTEEGLDLYRYMTRNHLFIKDMRAIQEAQAMILNYDESVQRGGGTLAEAWEAFREGRPVYVFSSFSLKEIPGWLVGESTRIFHSPQDLLKYISSTDQLHRDILFARLARDFCLNGIYN